MINTYSGKISRNDAENKILLNKEEIYKDEIFQKRGIILDEKKYLAVIKNSLLAFAFVK